jgi:hypothetical protein
MRGIFKIPAKRSIMLLYWMLVISPTFCQETKNEVPFSQLFREMFVETKPVEYKNVRFINDLGTIENDEEPTDPRVFLKSFYKIKNSNAPITTSCSDIVFNSCTFDDDIHFVGIFFNTRIVFQNCAFNGRVLSKTLLGKSKTITMGEITMPSTPICFDSCTFKGQLEISESEPLNQNYRIGSCNISSVFISLNSSDISITDSHFSKDSTGTTLFENLDQHGSFRFSDLALISKFDLTGNADATIQNCQFDLMQEKLTNVFSLKEEATLCFIDCDFNLIPSHTLFINSISGNLELVRCKINEKLFIRSQDKVCLLLEDNKFEKFSQPEINSLSKLSLVHAKGVNGFYFLPFDSVYFSKSTKDQPIRAEKEFDKGIASLKVFYDHYKEVGNIDLANLVYSRIRDIEQLKLKQRYRTDPSFNHFFSYQLSRLVRFYTNYGTDPARALVISFYIILLFGGFYFFFPSDWDVASKSRLIQNFKTFIEKNDKGYWKPFFILVFGFFLSLLNAITLSLNSFTTLGFGNIPTVGLARYVCVVQGFIGWFLLSLFTVALINQAQF